MPQPSTEDDSSLLALVQSGNEQAMASLFDRYSKLVFSVGLRVLRDPAAAEDILQEVFMQIWRNPDSFTAARGSLGGWLAIVARNRSIDTIRRRRPSVDTDRIVADAAAAYDAVLVMRAHAQGHAAVRAPIASDDQFPALISSTCVVSCPIAADANDDREPVANFDR